MKKRFERFHPLVPFLFYAGSISLLILMLHPVFLVIALVVICLINLLHDRFRGLRRWLVFIVVTFLLMVIMNPIFNERGQHVLFEINQHRVTVEAVLYGGMNALSIITVLAIFISFNIIMTPNKLLYLFSKVLPQFAVLLMLTLRFIPLMRRRLDELAIIQRSKGISISHGKWRTRVTTGMHYVQTLLTYSLEEAIQTADSMKARGYGLRDRSSYEYFKFRKTDGIALIYLLGLFCFIFYGRISGCGFLTIYPLLEGWELSASETGVLFCYIIYLSFPLLVEAGGLFRWRISKLMM